MAGSSKTQEGINERQRWMGILARSPASAVETAWQSLDNTPAYQILRGPETGLIMVRGRAGGGGQPFNLGEMTVTRCTLRLVTGEIGFAAVAGRDSVHSELAAALDALLQNPAWSQRIHSDVIIPLEQQLDGRRQAHAAAVAATKVDFFTLVRGD